MSDPGSHLTDPRGPLTHSGLTQVAIGAGPQGSAGAPCILAQPAAGPERPRPAPASSQHCPSRPGALVCSPHRAPLTTRLAGTSAGSPPEPACRLRLPYSRRGLPTRLHKPNLRRTGDSETQDRRGAGVGGQGPSHRDCFNEQGSGRTHYLAIPLHLVLSVPRHIFFSFFKFLFYLTGGVTGGRGGREISHLVHSPNGCDSRGWARTNPGAQNSILVSTWVQGPSRLELEVELGVEPRQSALDGGCPKGHGRHCASRLPRGPAWAVTAQMDGLVF